MTKYQYIELVQRWLAGGDAPADIRKKYSFKLVGKYCEMGYNRLLLNTWKFDDDPNKCSLNNYVKNYVKTITQDATTSGKYITVEGNKLIGLPYDVAIRYICPHNNGTNVSDFNNPYWRREMGAGNVFDQLEVGNSTLYPKIRWYYNDGKVWLENVSSETHVLLRQVVPFDSYSSTEDLPMPSTGDIDILTMVTEVLRQTEPKDVKPDANTELTVK